MGRLRGRELASRAARFVRSTDFPTVVREAAAVAGVSTTSLDGSTRNVSASFLTRALGDASRDAGEDVAGAFADRGGDVSGSALNSQSGRSSLDEGTPPRPAFRSRLPAALPLRPAVAAPSRRAVPRPRGVRGPSWSVPTIVPPGVRSSLTFDGMTWPPRWTWRRAHDDVAHERAARASVTTVPRRLAPTRRGM